MRTWAGKAAKSAAFTTSPALSGKAAAAAVAAAAATAKVKAQQQAKKKQENIKSANITEVVRIRHAGMERRRLDGSG